MAYAEAPTTWAFALQGALPGMIRRMTQYTLEGSCDWVLIPVENANVRNLKVPDGYEMQTSKAE